MDPSNRLVLVNFVIKLLHLAYGAVFFIHELIHGGALVVVFGDVAIIDSYHFEHFLLLVLLSFLWGVVERLSFANDELVVFGFKWLSFKPVSQRGWARG